MDFVRMIKHIEKYGECHGGDIQIAFGIDRKFSCPMGVSMTSVLMYNPEAEFHIFVDDLSESDKDRIKKTIEKYDTCCVIYYIDPQEFSNLPVRGDWSVAVYFRFLTASYLYGTIKRLLYMDADVICVGDISGLFQMDLLGKDIAAVKDPAFLVDASAEEHCRRINHNGDGYFNAGIMLINVDKWHNLQISKRAMQMLSENPDKWRRAQDQDVLNVLYENNVYWLDEEYNTRNNVKDIYPSETKLIHYSGSPKPWTEYYFSDKDISPYEEIRRNSEWKSVPLLKANSKTEYRFMSKKCAHNRAYIDMLFWQVRYLFAI